MNEVSLIKGYLQLFAEKHSISKREVDVINAILGVKSNIKDIAESLGLSPSTVNNHLNNIYEKTGASSKAELVSRLLIETLKHYRNCNLLKKTPRVLIVDDEAELCTVSSEILGKRGLKVFTATSAEESLKMIPEINVHFILSDINMPSKDGFTLMQKVKETHRYHPQFIFITGYSHYTVEQAQNLGALTVIKKPIDYDRLYDTIMENYIENFYERLSYLNIAENLPSLFEQPVSLTPDQAGFGGCFVPMPNRKSRLVASLKLGSRVKFDFTLPSSNEVFKTVSEVSWIREKDEPGYKAGIALKFLNVSEEHRDLLETFARNNQIICYIPIGAAQS